MNDDFRLLHDALLDLMGLINSPKPDAMLIADAGLTLDRALFPLLVRIDRSGPIGVTELADQVGRDYSTVSRQLAKMEAFGIITRHPEPGNGRVRQAEVTERGRAMADDLMAARDRLFTAILADWHHEDLHQLAQLTRRLADDAASAVASPQNAWTALSVAISRPPPQAKG